MNYPERKNYPRLNRTSDYSCQFRTVDSPIHRLGAGWKMIFTVILCAAVVAAREPWSLAAVLILNILYYFSARLTLSDLWRDTRFFFVQIVIVVGLYSIKYGIPEGLWPGTRISLQVVLFFIPSIVFLRTTKVSQMMRSMRRVISYRLSFLVFTSLRFVPFFSREIREIAMAQRLRGAKLAPKDLVNPRNWKDIYHCLIIPLMVRALHTSDQAALSAEARGFGLRDERTYFDTFALKEVKFNKEEKI